MADIKEKLKQLKREREVRSRTKSEQIKDAWEKIDHSQNLTLKEKLERLISLTREEKESRGGEEIFEPQAREPLQYFQNPHPLDSKYGKIPLSLGLEVKGEVLSCLSRDSAFKELDLSSALFLDLETTGLVGGSGVIPFLVGMGFYRDDRFYITQYFLGDLAEEERMIGELSSFFSEMDFKSVVSFNGKAFDLPLLETRFILNRQELTLSELPHLDFLFSARSLWRHKLESCRLYHLSREIVGADRSEDIPSSEIPALYFQYLRTGNFSLMEPVLYHNEEDILSLLGLVIQGAMLFSGREDEWAEDGVDFYGVACVFENIGEVERSVRFFQKALERNLDRELELRAKKKLSYYFKRKKEWQKAVSLWEELSSSDQLFSYRELAMYYEHRKKQYEEAKRIAEQGLALSMEVMSASFREDFAYRLERLNRKIEKQRGKS